MDSNVRFQGGPGPSWRWDAVVAVFDCDVLVQHVVPVSTSSWSDLEAICAVGSRRFNFFFQFAGHFVDSDVGVSFGHRNGFLEIGKCRKLSWLIQMTAKVPSFGDRMCFQLNHLTFQKRYGIGCFSIFNVPKRKPANFVHTGNR